MDAPLDPLESFLASAGQAALFLDVDGTLVAIAETPDAVVLEPDSLGLLAGLNEALGGALALVSGRSIDDLDRLFAPLKLPVAGLHGLQRRDAVGVMHEAHEDLRGEPDYAELRDRLAAFAAAHPGVLLEDKRAAIALHYRRAPAAAEPARDLIEALLEGRRDRLAMVPGKMVFEIKPVAADKGVAIGAFMAETPFAARRPVFIGDDVTDEDGFRIVNDIGGLSIRVGEAADSAALAALPDVAAVTQWLRHFLAAAKTRGDASS